MASGMVFNSGTPEEVTVYEGLKPSGPHDPVLRKTGVFCTCGEKLVSTGSLPYSRQVVDIVLSHRRAAFNSEPSEPVPGATRAHHTVNRQTDRATEAVYEQDVYITDWRQVSP